MKYVFKDEGGILTIKAADKADPQKIGEALEAIAQKSGGRLIPAAIVDAARERRHILHKHFEWDDATAAEAYRLDQARSIVRCIHVDDAETESGRARAFMSIHDKEGTSYRSLTEIMGNADLQAKVLAQAERDLISFENRYRDLSDVCELVRSARERIAARRTQTGTRAAASA